MATFHCTDCGLDKPIPTEGGTGYAKLKNGAKVCYACAGIRDRAEMIKTGKATLYLTPPECVKGRDPVPSVTQWGKLTNWPGTLEIKFHKSAFKTGRHNIAGSRYDVWFTGPDGNPWHGVTYGENTQLCHCKRIKKAA